MVVIEDKRFEDEVLSKVSALINEMRTGVFIVDPVCKAEFAECFRSICTKLSGTGVKITYAEDEHVVGDAVIRIEAKRVSVKDTKAFARAISAASNYEIYPREDGTLMFAITFYGLKKKIGE